MTISKDKYYQKLMIILCLCLACISTSTAQEATLATNVDLGPRPTGEEELIENDGQYYWYATNVNSRINDIMYTPNDFHFVTLPEMKSGMKIVIIESQGKIYKSLLTILN